MRINPEAASSAAVREAGFFNVEAVGLICVSHATSDELILES